jgi:hypothetical protein
LRQTQRRIVPRTSVQIPLRFRSAAKGGREWACQTINVSMLGAYFCGDVAPDIGELVQVFIEIPEEVSRKPAAHYCFTASVIHVEMDRPEAGRIGVGVNFYSYVRMEKSKQQRA